MTGILSLPEVVALANAGGYGGLTSLSPLSAVLLLSCVTYLDDLNNWEGVDPFNGLSQVEIDTIKSAVAITQGELMTTLVGLIMPYPSDTIPDNMLLCDGSTYERTDYPSLYDVLDAVFQINATQFVVPDLRNRVVRDTGAVGSTGGNDDVSLGVGNLPPHSHSEVTAVPAVINGGLEAPASAAIPGTGVTGTTGSGTPFAIVPSYLSLNYVIVAK